MTAHADNPGVAARWHFGPLPDLLLGSGLAYWILFVVMIAFGSELTRLVPITLLPLVVLFTGVPHYGATLLRVCERPDDRSAYALVTVASSLAMVALLALCLRNTLLGSLLLTLYLTWSPWHYSGQNYGIALMMLGRRGVDVSPTAKRYLHASFTLSFALIVLSLNGVSPGSEYAPVAYEETSYSHLTLGLPEWFRAPAMVLVATAYFASLVAAIVPLLRQAPFRVLAPAVGVIFSQGLWFAVPALARFADVFQETGPLSASHAAYAFVWVGVAHSVQYLWVTSYFALRSSAVPVAPGSRARAVVLGHVAKALAAGAGLWVLPALVFAPGALGRLPFDAGLAVMVAAAVNLHHFILDGVIWKLRDGRISRVLLRGQSGSPDAAAARVGDVRSGLLSAALLWSIGGACVLVFGGAIFEQEFGLRGALASGDSARAVLAMERLAWMGRDSARNRVSVGLLEAEEGNLEAGIAQLEQSTRIMETGSGLAALGSLYSRSGRVSDAEAVYRQALALEPRKIELLNNLAWLLAMHPEGDPARAAEAVALAERASGASGHTNPIALDTLAAAHAAAGDYQAARKTARRALAMAKRTDDADLTAEIEMRLSLYRKQRTLER